MLTHHWELGSLTHGHHTWHLTELLKLHLVIHLLLSGCSWESQALRHHSWHLHVLGSSGAALRQLLQVLLRHHLHVLRIHQLAKVQHLVQVLLVTQNLQVLFGTHLISAIFCGKIHRCILLLKLRQLLFQLAFLLSLCGFKILKLQQLLLESIHLIELSLCLFLEGLDLLILLLYLHLQALAELSGSFDVLLQLGNLVGERPELLGARVVLRVRIRLIHLLHREVQLQVQALTHKYSAKFTLTFSFQ